MATPTPVAPPPMTIMSQGWDGPRGGATFPIGSWLLDEQDTSRCAGAKVASGVRSLAVGRKSKSPPCREGRDKDGAPGDELWRFYPVEGAGYCFFPEAIEAVAGWGVHRGFPALVYGPVGDSIHLCLGKSRLPGRRRRLHPEPWSLSPWGALRASRGRRPGTASADRWRPCRHRCAVDRAQCRSRPPWPRRFRGSGRRWLRALRVRCGLCWRSG